MGYIGHISSEGRSNGKSSAICGKPGRSEGHCRDIKAAPFPRPGNKRMEKAKPNDSSGPVRIMLMPINISAKVMTIRVANRAAINPAIMAMAR